MLEKNFAEQRERLGSLTGGFDVLPLELGSFIALFPMILGLTLGLLPLVTEGKPRGHSMAACTWSARPDAA